MAKIFLAKKGGVVFGAWHRILPLSCLGFLISILVNLHLIIIGASYHANAKLWIEIS